ncbi:RNA polymerase sigma factor SigI [Paenibacillus nanensis]|uniref:RNA polymerase sigma factor SigI n=1 Tax=Paenibacillus nanensis TaxID=393251 RepID=A0A3A1UYE5_9BACL|nr:RNA polymerase sigma factor SigI [Paenibacillus nanensis]RIX52706.1 RNA polymerase sigma factor SigI [Paenibacillus nanensis]
MLLVLFKRFLRKSVPSQRDSSETTLGPEQYIEQIRQGDEALRERFIAEYSPYIVKTASKFCKRYVDPSRDDEFSVALVAFNEAINQYDVKAGASFLGFAKTVMQRRLIDHARKEQRHLQAVPYSSYDTEGEDGSVYNVLDTKQALQAHDASKSDSERRAEIEELNRELTLYGITFGELVEHSPKHADSRQILIGISAMLAGDERLMESLRLTQKMPIKELMEASGVSRKTLERNRKYIIAIAVILSGAYPYMNDYLTIGRVDRTQSREVSK